MLEIQEILLIVVAVILSLILLFCVVNICYFLWIRWQSKSSGTVLGSVLLDMMNIKITYINIIYILSDLKNVIFG